MEQEQLSKKERIAQQKAEKQAARDQEEATSRRNKLIAVGVIVVLLIAVIVYIVSSRSNPSSVAQEYTDPVKGNPEATVVVRAYEDFQCPACAGANPVVNDIMEEYGDRVQFVYNDFPLSQHVHAGIAAVGAECVFRSNGDEAFYEYGDLLFGNQENWSGLDADGAQEVFRGYADRVGADLSDFDACVTSDDAADAVNSDYQEGIKIGVNATPTFFVNDTRVTETPTSVGLRNAIESALNEPAE